METKLEVEKRLKASEFLDFRWVSAKDISVAQWVRVKCEFGCSSYGSGTCPPNTPSVEECRNFFEEYSTAVVIRLTKTADKENYPSSWSRRMTNRLLNLERQVFLLGFPKTFLLNQTCCGVCNECVGNRHDCIDKKNARPSPEAFAVDVYKTVRNVGLEINVVKEPSGVMNRIAILLIE